MKVTINIDCTPDEARAFFGLPDVKPIQEAMLAEMERQAKTTMEQLSPEAVMKTVFPAGMQSMEELQKMFWSAASGGAGPKPKGD